MIDYSKWKEDQLDVINLLLDPQNSRIPDSGTELSQRDLIADMVENDKVHELAKNIVDNGYYPIEALITVEETLGSGLQYCNLEETAKAAKVMMCWVLGHRQKCKEKSPQMPRKS